MSMHEIESLVEDSIHLVAKSKFKAARKRDFLFNLYHFQNRFDTGYTHFRLINTLLDLKFTYRISITEHPEYKKHSAYFKELDVETTHWLPSEIGKEDEFVFAKKEEEDIFLFVDAGSKFWQRLCQENILPKSAHQAPKKFQPLYLIAKLLWESQEQDNLQLMRDWLALLVNVIGFELDADDGVPATFLEFARLKEADQIRLVCQHNNPFSKPYDNDDWGALSRPILADIIKEESDVERLFIIRWLIDFDTDKLNIRSAYKEVTKPDPEKEKKMTLLPKALAQYFENRKWCNSWTHTYEYGKKWLYYRQIRGKEGVSSDADLCIYVLLNADIEDMKIITCKIGFQNGLIARWQGREILHRPEFIHFYDNLFLLLDKNELETNKSLHTMGGWKFNLKNTEKTILKHLSYLFESLEKHQSKALELYEKPLFANFSMPVEEAIVLRNSLKESHGYFFNEIEVYLVYAMYYHENGALNRAYELAEQVKSMAGEKLHPIAEQWCAAAESILEDKPKLNELLSFERDYF